MRKITTLTLTFILVCISTISVSASVFTDNRLYKNVSKYAYSTNYTEYYNQITRYDFGDTFFYFNKINANENEQEVEGDFINVDFFVKGNNIAVSYVDNSEDISVIKTTTDYSNLPLKTIFLETEMERFAFSVPTVYNVDRVLDTITTVDSYENPVTISQVEGGFNVNYKIPKDTDVYTEIFYFQSNQRLIDFTTVDNDLVIRNELSGRFRLLNDGFYQETPNSYYPSSPFTYYQNCANYVGHNYLKYSDENNVIVPFFSYLAYVSTDVTNSNQNDLGYFETSPTSIWLETDFNIGPGFYDTRFNADNSELNMMLYEMFNAQKFLDVAIRHGDFYVDYADHKSYKTENGILVQDYYNENGGDDTHVSLNHQLASMNMLLKLYEKTNKVEYYDTAMLMLRGIEDTEQQWIKDDGNLEYALMYTGTYNIMQDYPYLTYNDLYESKDRLAKLGISSRTIEVLMGTKLDYMVRNNIVGYRI
ncbi:MAG: hypothetical protein ACK5LV_01210 [Lachnospirales bacterium]